MPKSKNDDQSPSLDNSLTDHQPGNGETRFETHHGNAGEVHQDIQKIAQATVISAVEEDKRTAFLDRIFLHPVFGLLTLAVMMFVVFQAVFAWAAPFMDAIEGATD